MTRAAAVDAMPKALDLPALDGLEATTLVLLVGAEERPLSGVAGLVDWRLAGTLSRYLVRQRFEGRAGEKLLALGLSRLPVQTLLLVGRGEGAPEAEALEAAAGVAGEALRDARLDRVAVGLPRVADPDAAARAVRAGLGRAWSGSATVLAAAAD